MSAMEIEAAFGVVYELAHDNVIADNEVKENTEVLGPIQKQQLEALDIVHNYVLINIMPPTSR